MRAGKAQAFLLLYVEYVHVVLVALYEEHDKQEPGACIGGALECKVDAIIEELVHARLSAADDAVAADNLIDFLKAVAAPAVAYFQKRHSFISRFYNPRNDIKGAIGRACDMYFMAKGRPHANYFFYKMLHSKYVANIHRTGRMIGILGLMVMTNGYKFMDWSDESTPDNTLALARLAALSNSYIPVNRSDVSNNASIVIGIYKSGAVESTMSGLVFSAQTDIKLTSAGGVAAPNLQLMAVAIASSVATCIPTARMRIVSEVVLRLIDYPSSHVYKALCYETEAHAREVVVVIDRIADFFGGDTIYSPTGDEWTAADREKKFTAPPPSA